MKARIPAIRQLSKAQVSAAVAVANTEVQHAAYRVYLISCLALRDMGFGEKRMNEYISRLTKYMEEYGGRRAGEIADMKLFAEVETARYIPVDGKIKAQMLEYEEARFWGKQ